MKDFISWMKDSTSWVAIYGAIMATISILWNIGWTTFSWIKDRRPKLIIEVKQNQPDPHWEYDSVIIKVTNRAPTKTTLEDIKIKWQRRTGGKPSLYKKFFYRFCVRDSDYGVSFNSRQKLPYVLPGWEIWEGSISQNTIAAEEFPYCFIKHSVSDKPIIKFLKK